VKQHRFRHEIPTSTAGIWAGGMQIVQKGLDIGPARANATACSPSLTGGLVVI